MSNKNESNQSEKKLSRSTVTVVESESDGMISSLEENVVRMRYGLSEGDDHELSFAVGASEETRRELAVIEKRIYTTFFDDVETIE